jgi:hypothetical protein
LDFVAEKSDDNLIKSVIIWHFFTGNTKETLPYPFWKALELTREHFQLSNRFSIGSIAIGSVLVSSEKISFDLIFRSSLIDLWTFHSIFGP